MALWTTSLGPKPSLFFSFFVFVSLGHLTLALNPPFIFVFLFSFCFFVCFPFFDLNRKPLLLPPKKAIFVYLSVFPFVSLQPFWGLPRFPLSLSLSLTCSFLSSFLPVFHFCFSLLLFRFVLFASWLKMLFSFYFSACCLVLL